MSNDMAAVIGIIGVATVFALLVGFSTWVLSRRGQERARARIDLQRRILEKFGTAGEFVAFLESDGGRKFLESISSEIHAHAARIFASIQKGAIFTLIGVIGFLVILLYGGDDLMPLAVPCGIALAVGLGYLISAYVTYRLSKQWNLLPPPVA